MDPKTIEPAASPEKTETSWLEHRMEIERQWETALYNEQSAMVPSKLPISLPPIRHAA